MASRKSRDVMIPLRTLVVLWIAGGVESPALGQIVAANQPDSSSFAAAPGDLVVQAQTFTPSATGLLTTVDLPFFTSSPATGITLRLNGADPTTGLPGATSFASLTLAPEQVVFSTFSNPQYTSFDFSHFDITLNAGTPYSLVLSTPTSNFAYFVLTSPDAYPQGRGFHVVRRRHDVLAAEFRQSGLGVRSKRGA